MLHITFKTNTSLFFSTDHPERTKPDHLHCRFVTFPSLLPKVVDPHTVVKSHQTVSVAVNGGTIPLTARSADGESVNGPNNALIYSH